MATQKIRSFSLEVGTQVQVVTIPRRARIIAVTWETRITVYCLVDEDADTRAFETTHHRQFQIAVAGQQAPEGANFIGLCTNPPRSAFRGQTYLVFELPRVTRSVR